jgi:hypothetical protein
MDGGCEYLCSLEGHQDLAGGGPPRTDERMGAILGRLWVSELE